MHPVYYNNILWPTGPDVSSQILKLFLRVGLEQTHIFSLPAEEATWNCAYFNKLSMDIWTFHEICPDLSRTPVH